MPESFDAARERALARLVGRDRTATVIGGGSGIGRGVALGLAAEGMHVVVADKDGRSAEAVRDEVAAGGGEASAAEVDATERSSLEALGSLVERERGAVDVLVTTFGAIVSRRAVDASDAEWGWMLELNLLAHLRAVRVFLPRLRAARGPAHVVLTASLGGLITPTPDESRGFDLGPYVASKHALVAAAETLRDELAPEGIGVSVLCPTRIAGDLVRTSSRHRPARFGGPAPPPSTADDPPDLLPGEAAGPLVVRAIRDRRFLVLTHASSLSRVERHHRRRESDASD
ncbi:MAG: SDR family NAD(P)-dependent oxidoreductase [Planctomycetota bacterium JB042]